MHYRNGSTGLDLYVFSSDDAAELFSLASWLSDGFSSIYPYPLPHGWPALDNEGQILRFCNAIHICAGRGDLIAFRIQDCAAAHDVELMSRSPGGYLVRGRSEFAQLATAAWQAVKPHAASPLTSTRRLPSRQPAPPVLPDRVLTHAPRRLGRRHVLSKTASIRVRRRQVVLPFRLRHRPPCAKTQLRTTSSEQSKRLQPAPPVLPDRVLTYSPRLGRRHVLSKTTSIRVRPRQVVLPIRLSRRPPRAKTQVRTTYAQQSKRLSTPLRHIRCIKAWGETAAVSTPQAFSATVASTSTARVHCVRHRKDYPLPNSPG